MTISNQLEALEQNLYGRPSLEELSTEMAKKKGFRIVDVPAKGVDAEGNEGSNLGVTRFDWKKIFSATWLPKSLRDYVLGHETFVEAYGRPADARDHAFKEREYLENLKKDGYMNEYIAGLAMHYLRNKSGNTAPFRWIDSYINRSVARYRDSDTFKYHVENIDSVLRNKDSPGYKPSIIDSGYKAGEKIGKGIAEKGLGKYITDWTAEKLDNFAAKYRPAMKPAMEVG